MRNHPPSSNGPLLALAAVAVVLGACSPQSANPVFDGALATGTWGGDSAGMIVSDSAMHLHIACTYGDVSGRVIINNDGTFHVAGTYVLQAYPIAVGPPLPATFDGHLVGEAVTITATVDDTVAHQTDVRGPVMLQLGAVPQLGPCPICRRPIVTRRRTLLQRLLHW